MAAIASRGAAADLDLDRLFIAFHLAHLHLALDLLGLDFANGADAFHRLALDRAHLDHLFLLRALNFAHRAHHLLLDRFTDRDLDDPFFHVRDPLHDAAFLFAPLGDAFPLRAATATFIDVGHAHRAANRNLFLHHHAFKAVIANLHLLLHALRDHDRDDRFDLLADRRADRHHSLFHLFDGDANRVSVLLFAGETL